MKQLWQGVEFVLIGCIGCVMQSCDSGSVSNQQNPPALGLRTPLYLHDTSVSGYNIYRQQWA